MGKARGTHIAYYTFKKYGMTYLEKDHELRKHAYIDADVSTNELQDVSKEIYGCLFETIYIMGLFCLRERFNFGAKRAKQFTDAYMLNKGKMIEKSFGEWLEERNDTLKKIGVDLQIGRGLKKQDNDYQQGRLAGFEHVIDFVKQGKEAEIKQEIKTNMKVKLSIQKMTKQSDIVTGYIQSFCYDTILVMFMKTVNETFGFGRKRLNDLFKTWDEFGNEIQVDAPNVLDTNSIGWTGFIWVLENELNIVPETKWMIHRGLLVEDFREKELMELMAV